MVKVLHTPNLRSGEFDLRLQDDVAVNTSVFQRSCQLTVFQGVAVRACLDFAAAAQFGECTKDRREIPAKGTPLKFLDQRFDRHADSLFRTATDERQHFRFRLAHRGGVVGE